MATFLAAIPAFFAAAAPAAGAGAAGAGAAAAGVGAAGAGAAAAGVGAAGAGAATAGLGAAGAGAATAGVGASGATAAGLGSTLAAAGSTALKIAGPVAAAGSAIQQGQAQKAALGMAAKAEAEQVRAQQQSYQDRIRQVLSINVADAAGRGVVAGGSAAALQSANLRGAQIDIGFAGRQGSISQSLYDEARKRAAMRGFASAGSSLFSLGSDIASGKVF